MQVSADSVLGDLYQEMVGERPAAIVQLPGSGSDRTYYRLAGREATVIGAYSPDQRENAAFFSFTGQFLSDGLPVPKVLKVAADGCHYLLSDLGDNTLYKLLTELRKPGEPFPSDILTLYRKVVSWLPLFQVRAGKKFDFTNCYPRAAFDRQSMMWDLNYFKYYFLKLARVPFDEQALELDFQSLCDFLGKVDANFFLYRDFQSRNVMIVDGEPWFIDYQGGRKGALQYDLASLLVDAKADIPEETRSELLDFYLDRLCEVHPVNRDSFLEAYYGFVLIRILQALGAYGFRGYYEKKPHFLQSIPFALKNLHHLRTSGKIGFGLEALMDVIDRMIGYSDLYNLNKGNSTLTVEISSFSYKRGIPVDGSGHGGGFVFDCRALPNPGRYDLYRSLSGLDQPVIDYLKNEPAVGQFIAYVSALVDQSIGVYLGRGFDHLAVSFGCTGGQHRSVFCAEELARYLKEHYRINLNVTHTERDEWTTT